MSHYRIVVSTPYHGELFEARGTQETFVAALAAATAAVAAIEDTIVMGQIPVAFEVEVTR